MTTAMFTEADTDVLYEETDVVREEPTHTVQPGDFECKACSYAGDDLDATGHCEACLEAIAEFAGLPESPCKYIDGWGDNEFNIDDGAPYDPYFDAA